MDKNAPKIDTLYLSYTKGLQKITGDMQGDNIMNMIGTNHSADNSAQVQVGADSIGSGSTVSQSNNQTGGQMAGKESYADVAAGYFLGVDVDGTAKFNIGDSSSYVKWNGTTLTVVGGVNISQLNIPDSTTANSMHVDTSGNTWWGSNVAGGISTSLASIDASGNAIFKSIKIGGTSIQYTVSNTGIFSFGDGSDGTGTFDGSATPAGTSKSGSDYTLTRDVYYTDMTMSTGCTLNPSGYRIFGTGTLTLNGTAIIKRNGNAGGAGGNSGTGTGGTAGAALADGYLKGSVAGQVGGFNLSAGNAGTNTSNSIGSNGATGGSASSGGGGAAGTATVSNVKLIANWHLAVMLDVSSSGSTIKFDNSAGSGSGGSSISNGGVIGGGGGSGSSGGIIAIYVRNIVIGASASITANGGAGGAGGGGNVFGGGGGGGGNGGQIILVYNTITNSGSITFSGGVGGGSGGTGASAGSNGNAGTLRQFQISL